MTQYPRGIPHHHRFEARNRARRMDPTAYPQMFLAAQRTALINQMRGLLGECGIVFGQGPGQVRRGIAVLLAGEDPRFSTMARALVLDSIKSGVCCSWSRFCTGLASSPWTIGSASGFSVAEG